MRPLVHVAAETEDGFMIFDVFESQEAFDRFRAIASPIAMEAGARERRAAHGHFLLTRKAAPPVSSGERSRPEGGVVEIVVARDLAIAEGEHVGVRSVKVTA